MAHITDVTLTGIAGFVPAAHLVSDMTSTGAVWHGWKHRMEVSPCLIDSSQFTLPCHI